MTPAGSVGRPGRGRALHGALVLVLFGTALAAARPAAAQVAVDELEMHFSLANARGQLTQVIPVRNEQDRVQQVRVVLNDWQRDTLGRNVFLPLGTHPRSCGARVQAFPMTFQVAPGGTEYVRVTYDPGDAEGCWAIVLFESVQPPRPRTDQQGSFLSIEVRTGVKVYVHPAAPVKAGEIAFADVVQAWVPKQAAPGAPRDSALVWQADVRFTSAGNEHLRLRPTVEIRDRQGTLVEKVTGAEAYLTPNAVRDLRVTLPALRAGAYVALVLADYGGDEIAAAQVEFTVP